MTLRLIAACALTLAVSACIIAPPRHGSGWHDPHWHGGGYGPHGGWH